MTSLSAWSSADQRGISAIYFISDSRITWGTGAKWDDALKVFATQKYPHIFGYCGDVAFPIIILSQIITLIDRDLLFDSDDKSEDKNDKILSQIRCSFSRYPRLHNQNISILHCYRENKGMSSKFYLWEINENNERKLEANSLAINSLSNNIISLGSGKSIIDLSLKRWAKSEIGGTSRSIFYAFNDAVTSSKDQKSGGMPQLVSLTRNGPASVIGIIRDNERYVGGIPIKNNQNVNSIEWRNDQFEICDGETMRRKKNAQRQPIPKLK